MASVIGSSGSLSQSLSVCDSVLMDPPHAKLIFSHMPAGLEEAIKVCKKWSEIILKDPKLYYFFILARAKKIFAREIGLLRRNEGNADDIRQAFSQVVRVESLCDLAGAKLTLKLMGGYGGFEEDELLQIVRTEISMKKLDDAKATANTMRSTELKCIALCEIAKFDPLVLEEAKNLQLRLTDREKGDRLLAIAKAEVFQNNFVNAHMSVSKMASWDRTAAFIEISRIGAQHNLEGAKTWAAQIEDPKIKALVQFEIAIIEGDSETASRVVDQIEMRNVRRALAYVKIAKLDSSLGFVVKALSCMSGIIDWHKQAQVNIEIAKLTTSPDLSKALASALTRTQRRDFNISEDDSSNRKIALVRATYNLVEARTKATEIVNENISEETKFDIEMMGGDLIAAKAAAHRISNPFGKTWALIELARKDPLHDLTDAKASISGIENVYHRLSAMCEIAKMVLGDYTRTDSSFSDSVWRFRNF